MDVARLNMSHGTHDDHQRNYDMVRAASDASGHGVGIIADLQGPKIRLETFAEGKVKLAKGAEFVITTRDVEGDATICGTTYKGLPGDVSEGDPILVDDGKLRLVVIKVDDTDVTTRVEVAGKVSDHKGLNLPGRRGERARAVGEGQGRPALGAADLRRLHRAVLRPVRGRRRRRTRDHARGRRDAARHRQDREAAGDRQPRRGRQGVRRVHGGPRRPRRGVPARGRAVPAEARDRQGASQRQAGDRGDPDAGVDDHQPAARPAPRRPTSRTPSSTAPTP